MEVNNLTVTKDKVEACLAAINALHSGDMKGASGGSYMGGKQISKCYSWVSNPGPEGFKTLEDAFQSWRYDAHEDPNGNVHVDYFSGEKWGDDEILYAAIAPFVEDDASIEIRGEDGHQWRYLFEAGKYSEQTARVSWE
jgi:hypothetical protein